MERLATSPDSPSQSAISGLESPRGVTLVVDLERTTRLLWIVAAALVSIAVALAFVEFFTGHDDLHGVAAMFSLTMEANAPTWFSTCILIVASLLLLVIAQDSRARAGAPSPAPWYGLATIFAYLSLDELAQLHERFAAPLRAGLHTSGVLYYAWVIPAILMVLVVGAAYVPFLLKLPVATRRLFVIAAIVYVGASVGGEMIEGLLYSSELAVPIKRYTIKAVTTLEEGGEMSGVIVFIRALLLYVGATNRAGPMIALVE